MHKVIHTVENYNSDSMNFQQLPFTRILKQFPSEKKIVFAYNFTTRYFDSAKVNIIAAYIVLLSDL